MAADSQGSFFSSVSPQQLLAIFTLLGSIALMQFPPLQSRRENEKVASVPNDDHYFHASSIEDPLGALAAQHIVHLEDEDQIDPATQVQAYSHWSFYHDKLLPCFANKPKATPLEKEKPVLLVFAYLRSGEDSPSKEQRQRDRQAVVYGLHNSGYVPKVDRSLECLQISAPSQKMSDSGLTEAWNPDYNPKASIDIPFEWFKPILGEEPQKTAYRAVCILWLDSEVFSKMQKPNAQAETDTRPLDCLRSVIYNLTTGHPQPLPHPDLPPLAHMQRLLQLQPQVPSLDSIGCRRDQKIPEGMIKIGILGPPSSDMLTKFIAEAGDITGAEEAMTAAIKDDNPAATTATKQASKKAKTPREQRWTGDIQMSSPYATAPAQTLLRLAKISKPKEVDSRYRRDSELCVQALMNLTLAGDSEPPKGLFLSVPCSDDYTAQSLIAEMKLRGMQFDKDKGNPLTAAGVGDIVLISEFDTSYGRELPRTVYTAAHDKSSESKILDLTKKEENTEIYWHWTSYTRGLDGRFSVAGTRDTKDGSSSTRSAEKKRTPDEEPRGTNLTDAVRRLALQLKELHQRRQRENKPGIVAVGVLGGDVYDQLLILRALRPSFPHALFFCNNLDAWLWNHDELLTTRNLVIATPLGLYLDEQWQKGKPPFRNVYQTSVFAGILALASKDPYLSPAKPGVVLSNDKELKKLQRVHHYEIGHDGPVELDNQEKTTFWSPEPRKSFLRRLAGILAFSWLFWFFSSNFPFIRHIWQQLPTANNIAIPAAELRDWSKDNFGRLMAHPAWVFLISSFFLVFLYGGWKWFSAPVTMSEIEPLDLVSGISAWPFIGLNLAAALLALHFMGKALSILWRGERHLKHTYFSRKASSAGVSKSWEFAIQKAITLRFGKAGLSKLFPGHKDLKIGTYMSERLLHHFAHLKHHLKNALSGLLIAWNLPKIIIDSGRHLDLPGHRRSAAPAFRTTRSSPRTARWSKRAALSPAPAAAHPSCASLESPYRENKDLKPQELWKAYRISSKISARLLRSGFVALVIGLVAYKMSLVLPEETFAIRSESTQTLSTRIEYAALGLFIWLGALVFDTLWLNRIFIDWLGKGQSLWHDSIVKSFFSSPLHPEAQHDYIDLRLIEDWTREIGRLTALPFYVLACLCIARLGLFDRTPFPWHVLAILGFMTALVILGTLRVHRSAENLRAKALYSLDWEPANETESKEADNIISLIKGISGGAFMSFWRQPVMEAVYWLVSALSVTGLWQTISHFAL